MAGYLIDHLPYLIAYTKLISLELNDGTAGFL